MATIVLPDLDDDTTPGLFSNSAVSAAAAASAAGTFDARHAGPGLPALPPLRNPFASSSSDAVTTSPTEVRSRSGSTSNTQAVLPRGYGRHKHNASSSDGSSFASAAVPPPSFAPSAISNGSVPVPKLPLSSSEAAGELALGFVLESFIEQAEVKIGETLSRPIDQDLFLPPLLAEGVDPAFDDILASVAHIAKKLPQHVIDMIMRWRKSQYEGIDVAAVQRAIAAAPNPSNAKAIADGLNERKSLASIYILCRILTVVINAVDRQTLGEELGAKLEDIVFNSIKNAEPLAMQRSANKRANMELYARLIGSLSAIRFLSVADRFTAELDQINRGLVSRDDEPRVEHIIHGMRFLKLQVYPQDAFEQTAEFAETLANLFDAASGMRIKMALATTLVPLLSNVVKGATAEVNHPLWAKAMQTIYGKALSMSSKPRYVAVALPVICTTLAASPDDVLLTSWNAAADMCFNKMKDKAARTAALNGLVQMLWAYLHRCHETHTAVSKRLDPLFKAIFPPGRRSIYPADCPLELAACFPHYIAYRHFELGAELLSSLFTTATNDNVPLETLAPERLTIGVRATMRLLDSLERNTEPALPHNVFEGDSPSQAAGSSPELASGPLPESMLARAGFRGLLETVTSAIARTAGLCDRAFQFATILDDVNVLPNSAGVYSPDRELQIVRRHGGFTVTYSRERQPYFDLQRACFDSWPRCLRTESPDFRPIEILLRALIHVDADVCASARSALERLAKLADGAEVVRQVGRFACRSEFVYRETVSLQVGTAAKHEWIAGTWLTLIDIWLAQLKAVVAPKASATFEASSTPQRRLGGQSAREAASTPLPPDIDPRESWPLIVDIEATAVVLLCSGPVQLRRQALEGLRLAISLEELLTEWVTSRGLAMTVKPGKRILHVLESCAHLLTDLDEDRVPTPERSRLQRWRKLPDALIRMAESDSTFDFGLWQLTLGSAYAACLEASPAAFEAARPMLAARVLRLYQVSTIAAGLTPTRPPPQTPTSKAPLPPQQTPIVENPFLADHWRTHLTALCAVTTSPGSADSTTMKSEGLITSGTELVRVIIPFLASEATGLRDAVISGLGNVHPALYRTVLEGIQSIVKHLAEDRRVRQQQGPGARRSRRFDRLHSSVARIYELSSRVLYRVDVLGPANEAIMSPLLYYVRESILYFRDPDTSDAAAAVGMRRAFSNTVRSLVEYCIEQKVVTQWLPPDLLYDLFSLFDSWSFRPLGPISPEALRTGRTSSEGHGGHSANKSRGSSLGSQPAAFEVYLPATQAIVAICESRGLQVRQNPGDRTAYQIDVQEILRWTQAIFESISSAGHACARRALYGLLAAYPTHKSLNEYTVYQCFAEPETLPLQQSTYAVLSDAILTLPELAIKPSTLFCIALWKMGHSDTPTRQRSLDILHAHLPESSREETLRTCEIAFYNSWSGTSTHGRLYLAQQLALAHPTEARTVFLELAIRLMQVGCKQTRLLLQLLPAFISDMQLPTTERTPSRTTDAVLANLFLLFARFSETYASESRELINALANAPGGSNFRVILRFLVDETVRRGSKEFVRHAQRMVGCLCEGDRTATALQELADLIQPAEMLGQNDYESTPLANSTGSTTRRTNLDGMYPPATRKIIASPAQAAILIVGDALVGRLSTADPCIPRLMHALLVQVDHAVPVVRMHARECLVRAMTLLGKLPSTTSPVPLPSPVKGKEDGEANERSWRSFWEHDDDGIASADEQHTPRQMSSLITEAVRLLEMRIPDIRRLWGAVALEWATSCSIRHVACRSFQTFRLLMPPVSQRMLAEMLARLSATVADDSSEVQLFAREVIWTLSAIIRDADHSNFAELPQLAWACVVCLDTATEAEFGEVMRMMEALLTKLEAVQSKTLVPALESCRPSAVASATADVVRLVAQKGLRSTVTFEMAWSLLRRLATSSLAPLVAPPEASLAILYATAMLFGMQALEVGKVEADLEGYATTIAKLGEAQGKHNISRVMLSLAKNRFRTKDDFLRQATGNLTEYFSVAQRIDVFVFFLGTLFNPTPWLRLRSMALLKAFGKQACLTEVDCEGLGLDAAVPLLDLLNTPEYSRAAREVLDEAFPLAKRWLQQNMSRTGPAAIRRAGRNRPFNSDGSPLVFGEASPSGWNVAVIAQGGQATRRRLREVVDTCGALLGPDSTRSESPIAFAVEEFDGASAAHDGAHPDEVKDANDGDASTVGDMVDALHDLGSFFDDESAASGSPKTQPNGLVRGGPFGDRFAFENASAASSPAFRMSQALGSASRVAAVLARSLRPSGASHGHSASSSIPRMATISESTPFNAAFAEPPGATTPRVPASSSEPTSAPLTRYNSEGMYSTASSASLTTSRSRSGSDVVPRASGRSRHARNRSSNLSSESEGESAWGDEGSSQPASSHENVRFAHGGPLKAFTPMPAWAAVDPPGTTTSDGDDDSLFGYDDTSPGQRRRRPPAFLRKRSPKLGSSPGTAGQ